MVRACGSYPQSHWFKSSHRHQQITSPALTFSRPILIFSCYFANTNLRCKYMASFEKNDIKVVSDALEIAEDATGNFYKFSLGQWGRHRYDVKTRSSFKGAEVNFPALAVLLKGMRTGEDVHPRAKEKDFYFICLQDHSILEVLERDRYLTLLPLLIYVFTHELVHIVRFCNFFQMFDVSQKKRSEEEEIVHWTTFEILKDFSLPNLSYVLESYRDHRICEIVS